eukprot:TRINITY_DN2863_c2_g1_i1.p1 TRINITY_DN2863_c2_g1~~TRINITY_DN2863_c2_g1_i1.p1  ORF type:complete len:328 (+),score=36.07 TRINITY_DN2863_c2_g1_i1:138-1121(+)
MMRKCVAVLLVLVVLEIFIYASRLTSSAHVAVWASGGLGNRMAGVINGIWLSHTLKIPLIIHWEVDKACGAAFDDLFDYSKEIHVIPKQPNALKYSAILATPKYSYLGTAGHWVFKSFDSRQTSLGAISDSQKDFLSWALTSGRGYSILYVNDHVDSSIDKTLLSVVVHRTISVKRGISIAANKFIQDNNLTLQTIGIHLRATDAARSVNVTAIASDVIRRFPKATQFVCSDSKKAEDELIALLPKAARRYKHSYAKLLEPNLPFRVLKDNGERSFSNIIRDEQSVIDAMIDLLILSRVHIPTPRLYGSVISSFVSVAELIKDIGLK